MLAVKPANTATPAKKVAVIVLVVDLQHPNISVSAVGASIPKLFENLSPQLSPH